MKLTKQQSLRNLWLTIIKYACLFLFLILSPLTASGIWWQGIEFSGFILGVWSIFVMSKSKLNITPQPKHGAILVESGPYKVIRHPMYSAIIITFTPLIITHFDYFRLAIIIVLYLNLIFKLLFEESLLKEFFKPYKVYMKSTWRLIPFIF